MATFKRFEDIEVWRLARKLAKDVYVVSRSGELARDFGFRDQIQRAAVSVGSNVAEGFARSGNKEFVQFLWIARGSVAELASQMYTLLDVGYVNQERFEDIYAQCETISVKIYRLITSITTSGLKGPKHQERGGGSSEPLRGVPDRAEPPEPPERRTAALNPLNAALRH